MRLIQIAIILAATSVVAPGGVAAATAKAVFAGGCFWCMEADFEKLDGVTDVMSGFTGGTAPNPTYHGNHDGHYEAVEITYDPDRVSYHQLLDHFWVNVDPFDGGGQFCDRGTSYLSALFVADPAERALAERSRQAVVERFPNQTVVTPVLDAATFYPVKGNESYHQDYAKNNPVRYKFYRWNCGRDQRLDELWGADRVPPTQSSGIDSSHGTAMRLVKGVERTSERALP